MYYAYKMITDWEKYNKYEKRALRELNYMSKCYINYDLLYVNDKLISNVFIEDKVISSNIEDKEIISNKMDNIILNKLMKLGRIANKYTALGYNPPIYFVCYINNKIKIIQVGFQNKFNNCIDVSVIDNNIDLLILNDSLCCPKEIVLPDNIELRITSDKYNNTLIKNIDHIIKLDIDYDFAFLENTVRLKVDEHLIFDRITNKELDMKFFKNAKTIEIKKSTNVERVRNITVNELNTLILNENIHELFDIHVNYNKDTKLCNIITPLLQLRLNGYNLKYNSNTMKYETLNKMVEILNHELIIFCECLKLISKTERK